MLIRGGFVPGAWWRRAEVWRQPQERLQSLLSKAVENLAAAVEEGDLKASIEVLKAVGMYGDGTMNAIHEQDPEKLIRQQAESQVGSATQVMLAGKRFFVIPCRQSLFVYGLSARALPV